MTITKKLDGNTLTLEVEGRLDTLTAPELEKVVKEELDGVNALIYDLSKLTYVSSAGLRVLLLSNKIMSEKGGMLVRNATKEVIDVFELTGFTNILRIE